ncbi:MAG: Uncharacterized MFS-type transporter, partial [uncultured Nocardioidaceae bacterium]
EPIPRRGVGRSGRGAVDRSRSRARPASHPVDARRRAESRRSRHHHRHSGCRGACRGHLRVGEPRRARADGAGARSRSRIVPAGSPDGPPRQAPRPGTGLPPRRRRSCAVRGRRRVGLLLAPARGSCPARLHRRGQRPVPLRRDRPCQAVPAGPSALPGGVGDHGGSGARPEPDRPIRVTCQRPRPAQADRTVPVRRGRHPARGPGDRPAAAPRPTARGPGGSTRRTGRPEDRHPLVSGQPGRPRAPRSRGRGRRTGAGARGDGGGDGDDTAAHAPRRGDTGDHRRRGQRTRAGHVRPVPTGRLGRRPLRPTGNAAGGCGHLLGLARVVGRLTGGGVSADRPGVVPARAGLVVVHGRRLDSPLGVRALGRAHRHPGCRRPGDGCGRRRGWGAGRSHRRHVRLPRPERLRGVPGPGHHRGCRARPSRPGRGRSRV